MALTGTNNEQRIWNYLKAAGLSEYGVAGLMGNLYAESGLIPENLQNSYEPVLGYSDESYTAAVDSGSYTRFSQDSAGYGLAQWTYSTRKAALLAHAKQKGKSVGDLETQLEFLVKELAGYPAVLSALKTAGTVKAASDAVLTGFERPANMGETVKAKRAEYGQTYYSRYASKPAAGGAGVGAASAPAFVMRTSKPGAGNKYFIRKASGGYSDAIKGSPTDAQCDVLANCVGYAYGRFNEIGGWGSCKFLRPVNAENFIQYKDSALEVGQTPRLGACMVWQRGATLNGADGAGHVAIVEKVVSDTEVYTSESGYNSKAFWNQTRKKGDGNWGQSSPYKFLGFIYNPAQSCTAGAQPSGSTGGTTGTSSTPAPNYSAEIKKFQSYLKAAVSSGLAVDGSAGPATKAAAVKAVQTILNLEHNAGLAVDGSCGAKTKEALKAISVKSGTTGALAYLVQGLLYCKGYNPNGFDGKFGGGACDALGKFQSASGINADKVAGQATLEKLLA